MPALLASETVAPAPSAPLAPDGAPAPAAFPSPFSEVISGALPAVSLAPISDRKTDPAQEFVVSNLDELTAAGLDYHELKDNHSVLFNPAKITAAQLDEADKAGKLFEIAPLVHDLAAPGGAAEAPVSAPPGAGPLAGATAGAPVNRALQTDRLAGLAPAPTGAPNPVPGQLARRAI